MPLKITFELSDADLGYFKKVMGLVRDRSQNGDEEHLRRTLSELIGQMRAADMPEFVRERVTKLEQLVRMIEDEEWALAGADRSRVIQALAYFAHPEDLIPDRVPGLGYLDDAIMVELVVQELRHEIEAYQDFCRFRSQKEQLLGREAGTVSRERWLAARRQALQSRMRRRRRRHRSESGGGQPRSPFALF